MICPNCRSLLELTDPTLRLVIPPPPPPPLYLRLVSVLNAAQLLAAVATALPGDRIELAGGTTYELTGTLPITRSGTPANPITLVGPRSAVINGYGPGSYTYLNPRCSWWAFEGFRVQNSIYGIETGAYGSPGVGASDCVFRDLDVGQTGNCGMVLRGNSSRNTVRDCLIHDTGLTQYWYGEGIYIGSGVASNHPANDNLILNVTFGPNVRADHVDVKGGTQDNRIEGCVSDATGWMYTDGSTTGGQVTTAVYSNQGLRTIHKGNTVKNLNAPKAAGFQNWQGSGTRYRGGNKCLGAAFAYGFSTSGGTDNVIGCDNAVPPGMPFANVPCTP
jgi:hypothetical protein